MTIQKFKKCWVIGTSVEKYSLSPGMHRIIYEKVGLNNWEYNAKNIENKDKLKEFCDEARSRNYIGFNVTVPYKQDIMRFLDDIAPSARTIGAVNTVVNRDGKLTGDNTDWNGFMRDLRESFNFYDVDAPVNSVLVLGAGGASRAVVWGLKALGVNNIYIYDLEKAQMDSLVEDLGLIKKLDKEELYAALEESDLLLNATNVGMNEGQASVLPLKGKKFKKNLKVYDVIYNRKTELLTEAEELGLKVSGGMGMLAWQGLKAFELWYKNEISDEREKIIIERMKEYLRKEVYKND